MTPAQIPRRLSRLAVAAVVASILGLFTYGVFSAVALVLGVMSLRRLRATEEPIEGKGWTLGAIAISGATLFVVLITGPLGLTGSPGGCAAFFKPELPLVIRATTGVRNVHSAAMQWRNKHGGVDCPTMSSLLAEQLLRDPSQSYDSWGSTISIFCEKEAIIVVSPGPDGRLDTSDDIVVRQ